MYHVVLFHFSASILSTVGDLGKSYVVWEEIFDNGLKVQALHHCVVQRLCSMHCGRGPAWDEQEQ